MNGVKGWYVCIISNALPRTPYFKFSQTCADASSTPTEFRAEHKRDTETNREKKEGLS